MVKIDIENTRKAGGRMEEVKTIILKDVLPFVDRGIEFMGRGFADEVFRVFQEEHPEIKITPLHASTSMLAMIRHLGGKQQ